MGETQNGLATDNAVKAILCRLAAKDAGFQGGPQPCSAWLSELMDAMKVLVRAFADHSDAGCRAAAIDIAAIGLAMVRQGMLGKDWFE